MKILKYKVKNLDEYMGEFIGLHRDAIIDNNVNYIAIDLDRDIYGYIPEPYYLEDVWSTDGNYDAVSFGTLPPEYKFCTSDAIWKLEAEEEQ